MIQSFWNVSVTSVALLGDDPPPIDGASRHALVRPDGTLTLDGRPVERPLLIATSGTRPIFASCRVVAAAPGFELIEPSGPMRLAGLVEGLRGDGWLAPRATVRIWPGQRSRCLSLTLTGGLPTGAVSVRLRAPGDESTVRLHPKSRHELHFPIAARRVWTATLTADRAASLPAGGTGSARAHVRLATPAAQGSPLLKDRRPRADRSAVTTTLSPPIRILGIVGILAAAALGLLLFMQSRSSHTATATPLSTAGTLHSSTKTPASDGTVSRPSTHPATPAAPKIVLLPGLPGPVAHALRYSKVVVVSLYAAGAAGDRAAFAQARLGAASAHAGFAAVNVLNERTAVGLDKFAGATSSPAVLVVRRPGRIVNRFQGYADSDLVAQAAQNAGARASR